MIQAMESDLEIAGRQPDDVSARIFSDGKRLFGSTLPTLSQELISTFEIAARQELGISPTSKDALFHEAGDHGEAGAIRPETRTGTAKRAVPSQEGPTSTSINAGSAGALEEDDKNAFWNAPTHLKNLPKDLQMLYTLINKEREILENGGNAAHIQRRREEELVPGYRALEKEYLRQGKEVSQIRSAISRLQGKIR
jgi:hypothetical protein